MNFTELADGVAIPIFALLTPLRNNLAWTSEAKCVVVAVKGLKVHFSDV